VRGASVLAIAALLGCGTSARPPAAPPIWERPGLMGHVRPEMGPPQPGDAAPDFDLPKLDGTRVRLSSLRGSWVVLHFTASWCPYCDSEVEHLGKLADAYAPRGVKVVLVDIKEDASRWETYAKEHVAPSVIALHDATGEASRRLAPPRAQPSFVDRAQVLLDATLLVDPAGVIRLFLLPDSAHFDPTLSAVKRALDRMMGAETRATAGPVAEGGPAETLPPERVVELAASVAGEYAIVRLRILPGYHIMSNVPSKPSFIATRVRLEPAEGLTFGEPVYPAASSFALGGEPISVFERDVEVRVPFRRSGRTAPRTVSGSVRYQACTATLCLFPVTRSVSFDLAP
jgi:peroxiredoxin